jgi:cysteinyl-tRNA synthetase
MSKSDGNFITVHELVDHHDGEIIRLALMQSHYRQPLDWTDDALTQARKILDRFYGALDLVGDVPAGDVPDGDVPDGVLSALADDLNVPLALSVLHELANTMFKESATATPDTMREHARSLRAGGQQLGILQKTANEWFAGSKDDTVALEALIMERNSAKQTRDFKRADEIRDQIQTMGYVLLDSADGTTWRKK